MEYMACGLPVVCSSGGGNAELVTEGETGYLVPWGNSRSLCDRLERLDEKPDEAAALGAAGRRRIVEEFTAERVIDGLVGLYEEQLRTRRRRPGSDRASGTMSGDDAAGGQDDRWGVGRTDGGSQMTGGGSRMTGGRV
jgi:hypothetical protein